MKPKPLKRPVNGILLLDKPTGISSNHALQKAKRLFRAKKAGHTGSLDPLASGMLPLCFGEATKFSQYLLSADKSYHVRAKLGQRTTTSDAEGEVVSERAVPNYDIADIEKVLMKFLGETQQVPSMYSALKHNGQPLYKLARQGIEVERPARSITVYDLHVLDYHEEVVEFTLHCTKGTYVRTIVDDFGEMLGCGAHVVGLRRLNVGSFQEAEMVSFEMLEAAYDEETPEALDRFLLPVTHATAHFPLVQMEPNTAFYFRQGQAVMVPFPPTDGMVAVTHKNGEFIGVGEVQDDGKIAPRRLVQNIS